MWASDWRHRRCQSGRTSDWVLTSDCSDLEGTMSLWTRVLLAAFVTGVSMATHVAFAADTPKVAAPKAAVVIKPSNPWHGVYFGGGGGWAFGQVDGHTHLDVPGLPTVQSEDYFTRFDSSSGLWSAVVGADVQHGA